MSAGPSKRTRRQPGAVDAVVVDAHDRALVHWHNAIRARQLPLSKIGLVHFDSHPDLGIPDHLQAATVFKPDELYQQIDIAEFILPAVFAGHVSHMLWIRPPWARQIADGKYTITVGRELISGLVKVHCGEQLLPYFVDDGAAVERLEALDGPSCKTLALCVAALPLVPAQHAFLSDASVSTWILDIDLDYFSTTNPWLQELAFRRPASLNGDLRVLSSVFLNAVWHADLISEAALPPGVDSAICVAISETPLVDSESIRSTAAYFDYRRKLASLLQLLCRLPSRSNSVAGQTPPDSEVSWLTFHDNQDRFVAAGSELLGSYLHQTHGPGVLLVYCGRFTSCCKTCTSSTNSNKWSNRNSRRFTRTVGPPSQLTTSSKRDCCSCTRMFACSKRHCRRRFLKLRTCWRLHGQTGCNSRLSSRSPLPRPTGTRLPVRHQKLSNSFVVA
ncbi:hypothetical protein CAOG_05373 [Capsaspora owczarzaki ATCC 30864]|uniref:hypothetical protein n=1 Tax=Capsaspora owczarzaki (strain ATCC 30864) TaxID=595528 RepID=UPI0003526289|nr:hypothetical protein CAOG_05373 [Capsaspora owczarzaki ATCC 30864]|eukprot:XP_004347058.2 hypothetical protein CAOG_05373 [Capsaspora owczarzaki ATCC 30864]